MLAVRLMQVRALETAQQTAVEEIMSYVESTPILKEAAHAQALEEHKEWAQILGVGYSDKQRRDLSLRLRRLGDPFDFLIGVDEIPSETRSKGRADRRFPGAHHPHQEDRLPLVRFCRACSAHPASIKKTGGASSPRLSGSTVGGLSGPPLQCSRSSSRPSPVAARCAA